MKIFFKNETGIFGIFRNLGMRVFKNESGIFRSFGNFEENYSKKSITKEITFYKTIQRWHFKKIRLQQAQRKTRVVGNLED